MQLHAELPELAKDREPLRGPHAAREPGRARVMSKQPLGPDHSPLPSVGPTPAPLQGLGPEQLHPGPLPPGCHWAMCAEPRARATKTNQNIPHSGASPAPGWPPAPSWAPRMWLNLRRVGRPRRLPVLALLFLVPLQEGAGKLAQAEATLGGQLAHGFLHSQVAAAEALTDLTTTVRACGLLLLQPGIC